jgi:hypothetical protein
MDRFGSKGKTRLWASAAIFIGFCAGACAQNTGVVTGVVRDSVTKAAIPEANVRLEGTKTLGTKADTGGKYRFDGIPEGRYELDAYLEGFVAPSTVVSLDIRFSGGEFSADVTLDPLATLRGHVIDARGNPVPDASIAITHAEMFTSFATKTDAEGRFTLKELEPGGVYIRAQAKPSPKPADPNAIRVEPLATYYPSEPNLDSAIQIHLVPGDRNTYDIQLMEARVQRVRGVVGNQAGDPVPRANVLMTPASPVRPLRLLKPGETRLGLQPSEISSAALANDKGEFEFASVPAGAWNICATLLFQTTDAGRGTAAPQVLSPAPHGCTQVLVAGGDEDNIVVTLDPPFDMLVTLEGDMPPNFQLLPLLLFSSTSASAPFGLVARPVQADAHTLVFRNVSPGNYAVRSFSLQGSRYIASVNVGGQEAIGKEVKLGPGIPVNIVFASGSPTLSGTVDLSNGDSGEGKWRFRRRRGGAAVSSRGRRAGTRPFGYRGRGRQFRVHWTSPGHLLGGRGAREFGFLSF